MSYPWEMRSWWLALLPALSIGCTHDFGTYEPVVDGGADGADASADGAKNDGAPADGQVDAPACTPSASCTSAAKNCSDACRSTQQNCVDGCGNNNGCKQQCNAAETTCKSGCVSTCVSCTTQAGCAGQSACNNAVN